jgi:hypothetical protein
MTVQSVTVDPPFTQVTTEGTCVDLSADVQSEPICAAGASTPCIFGIGLPPSALGQDLENTYNAAITFTLVCTSTEGQLCDNTEVVARGPSPSSPVTVEVQVTTPLRYCVTGYDDGHGGKLEDIASTSAANGCVGGG